MKNNWTVWFIVLGVVVVILFVFNFQAKKDLVPVNHILPEETSQTPKIEYEFVDRPSEEIPPTTAGSMPVQTPTTAGKSNLTMGKPVVPILPSGKAGESIPGQTDFSKVAFTIQAVSVRDKVAAEGVLTKLRQQGHPAYLVTKNLGAKGTWHRIYIGTFSTKPQADEYLGKVKTLFKDAYVVSPKN